MISKKTKQDIMYVVAVLLIALPFVGLIVSVIMQNRIGMQVFFYTFCGFALIVGELAGNCEDKN